MSTNEIERDTAAALESGLSEEIVEIVISTPQDKADDRKRDNKHYFKKLYRAALKGDWSTATDIYKQYPKYLKAKLSREGDTALHIAAAAESSNFFLNLVDMMNPEDLAIKNEAGNTAFCLVAASGKLELAQAMLKKKSDLQLICDEHWMFPLEMAAHSGHKEMVEFLYDEMKRRHLDEVVRTKMFHALIRTGFYDVALDLLKEHPELPTVTALSILAQTSMMSFNFDNQNQEGFLKRCFDLCGRSKFCHKKLHPQALKLVKLLWEHVDLGALWIWEVIFVAAERENIEFLNIIICDYPALILKVNKDNHSIFHVAVLNRQKDIFKLIYEINPSFKNSILQYKDDEENNILHLAGMLAPPDRLNTVSGVALQLQQELLWFEEVRRMVHPLVAEAENRRGKTPRALFTEMHTDLKEKGEKWMKDTANSCMIVATLIATVVFAAAFTIPGGAKEDTGTPHFIQRVSFITFVISDAISLVSSTCSILTFLSILTSRFAEEDFLLVLPRKLVVGLSTLFCSIAAMMIVFCATIFIVFKDGMIWVPVLVSVIACLPVILFTKQQWRLLFDVAHSLFQTSKHNLCQDEGKARELKKEKHLAGWHHLLKNAGTILRDNIIGAINRIRHSKN